MKKYAVVVFAYSSHDVSCGLGVGNCDYLGDSEDAADAAFEQACDQAEINTRHVSGLIMQPISVSENEVDEDDEEEEEEEIQFKLFKDHPYGDNASDGEDEDKEGK